MIESLADHGVQAEDLVPALMTTHSVKNPEYDPKAAKDAELERHKEVLPEEEAPPPPSEPRSDSPMTPSLASGSMVHETETSREGGRTPTKSSSPSPTPARTRSRSINPFGDDDDEEDIFPPPRPSSAASPPSASASTAITSPLPKPKTRSINPFGDDEDEEDGLPPVASSSRFPAAHTDRKAPVTRIPSFDDDDDGDIGRPASPTPQPPSLGQHIVDPSRISDEVVKKGEVERDEEGDPDPERTPTSRSLGLPPVENSQIDQDIPRTKKEEEEAEADEVEDEDEEKAAPLPSLPGVSTTLTSADENVVLDIRWTVVRSLLASTSTSDQ